MSHFISDLWPLHNEDNAAIAPNAIAPNEELAVQGLFPYGRSEDEPIGYPFKTCYEPLDYKESC